MSENDIKENNMHGQEYKWFVVRSSGDYVNRIETGFEYYSDAKDYVRELKEYWWDIDAKIYNLKTIDPIKLAEFRKSLESL